MRSIGLFIATIVFCCPVGKAAGVSAAEMKIDADYPGGNIIVDRIDGSDVYLRQDLRDTKGWWFYWNFRVRGAAGRTLTFQLTRGNPIGVRGPAVSTDDGKTWAWLGTGTVKARAKGASFRYSFPRGAEAVRFCFAVPYQDADLRRFLKRHAGSKHLIVKSLCKTRKGRTVERLHVGKTSGEPTFRVLLTCRHHSCEMMASYVLEGVLAAVLADTADGRWFRRNVEVMAVPFMDKDGVEDGDQGKNRKPRDHCRDYAGKSLYPSVAALRELAPQWSGGRLKIALDLHCPWIRGRRNEVIYMVGSRDKDIWSQQRAFGAILESVRAGPLAYKAADNLPFGKDWNTGANYKAGKSFFQWADELEDIRLSSAFEIPYANAAGKAVTPDSARGFGADLAVAIRRYLEAPAPAAAAKAQAEPAKAAKPPLRVTAPPKAVIEALKLSPFYRKYASANGVPVIGSAKVSDYALLEAAYLIDRMLADRQDICRAIARNKVRVVVMGVDEFTTDVPEHGDLRPKGFWDRRARGLGATPHRPATSCGEENLLRYKGDPYAAENILIHEFAHTIHHMGLNTIDKTFDKKLKHTYEQAMAKGLWKGKYAATNRAEYWAEAVQSWFDTNRPPDHDHNHVDTREELKKYDPGIAKLVAEVFGDKPWRYCRPSRRKDPGHLVGYDRAKAPRFAWPPRVLAAWREDQARKRAAEKAKAAAPPGKRPAPD